MILAAFGAVDGNLNALVRTLDAVDTEGIQTIACTGNCALGPQPNEVIELLRSRQVFVAQGDTDRLVARLVRKRKRIEREVDANTMAALDAAHRLCTSANLEWLAALPHTRTFKVDGEPVALFHGTLASATARLNAGDPDELFRRQREMVPARVFIAGGGSTRFTRVVDDALFANPGPLVQAGGAEAAFLVVSTETGGPTAEVRTVALASSA